MWSVSIEVRDDPSGRDENYMSLAAFFVEAPHVLSVYKALASLQL